MRLLVVNSNTSAHVTDMVATAARAFASPGTELSFATGDFGARIVASRTENVIAAHSTLDLVARHSAEADGVLIAVSYDSGLLAARELLGRPVIGLTEAALLTAVTLGSRIGLIVFGHGAAALYHEVAASYGLTSRICGARRIATDAPFEGGDQTQVNEDIVRMAQDLVDTDEAEVVILTGAVLGGRSLELQDRVSVPLLDGVRCGVPLLEAMVRIGARAPASGSLVLPGARASTGLSPELAKRLMTAVR